jgi:phosphonate transport system permease protein
MARASSRVKRCRSWRAFVGEFFPPDLSTPILQRKVPVPRWKRWPCRRWAPRWRRPPGLVLAVPASRARRGAALATRRAQRCCAPSLSWCGPRCCWSPPAWGPFAGTLALALHTTGVLGRLLAEGIENAARRPRRPRCGPVARGRCRCSLYATLPQVLPQLVSYTLYRWENNIRAATVLGVVGAGGLGQQLAFHMGLFQMGKTATVLARCWCWWPWWTP